MITHQPAGMTTATGGARLAGVYNGWIRSPLRSSARVMQVMALLALLQAMPITTRAADRPAVTISADANHRWGARDATGATVVPFDYDHVSAIEPGFFLVGMGLVGAPSGAQPLVFGVVDGSGREIIAPRFRAIERDRRHHRFKVWQTRDDVDHQGYVDESGGVVVPIVFDSLERVSNMGDEPTAVAERGGKFGYLDFVTGQTLIPVEYDTLVVDDLLVDAEGRGMVTAAKDGKWGVISTEGNVIAPFEFDHIGRISPQGTGIAERGDDLVELRFSQGRLTGTAPVTTVYSSDFVPRLAPSINVQAFDGLYVAADYSTMKAAWTGWREGMLRWVAIPSIRVKGNEAEVAFGLFARARLPLLRNLIGVSRQKTGFTLMVDIDKQKRVPFLTFRPKAGSMVCVECERRELPVIWARVEAKAPAAFGGIGVVIAKSKEAAGLLAVLDVLRGGPADKAGLRVQDRIVEIDDQPVVGLDAVQATAALRGPAGSKVRLGVSRDGGRLPAALVVTREAIQLKQ